MQVLNVQWKWNVPNTLSLLRLALVPVFSTLYLTHHDIIAFAVLVLSGLTDALDGFIARRFDQITDCGKLLDPIADKLTQVMVVICLTTRYTEIWPLAALCFGKEVAQTIGGIILLRGKCEVKGSKWFGKLSTVLFYASMLVIVLWHDKLEPFMLYGLVGVVALTMLYAFFRYLRMFIQLHRSEVADSGASDIEQ